MTNCTNLAEECVPQDGGSRGSSTQMALQGVDTIYTPDIFWYNKQNFDILDISLAQEASRKLWTTSKKRSIQSTIVISFRRWCISHPGSIPILALGYNLLPHLSGVTEMPSLLPFLPLGLVVSGWHPVLLPWTSPSQSSQHLDPSAASLNCRRLGWRILDVKRKKKNLVWYGHDVPMMFLNVALMAKNHPFSYQAGMFARF